MSTDLFEVKNYFILGNYQGAINAGNSVKPSSFKNENDKAEKDAYVYRCYIAQGNLGLVLQEIKEKTSHPSLQAVRLLALYLSKEDSKEQVVSQFKQILSDTTLAGNFIIQLMAATVYFHEENYEEAMRCVYQTATLEGLAFLVQIYLKINRLDEAEKVVQGMHTIEDDATMTQLATAWLNIVLGGDKLNESLATFKELGDKYGYTSKLYGGIANCYLQQRKFEEAEKVLNLGLEKNANDADIHANLTVLYVQNQRGSEALSRQLSQLSSKTPKHPLLVGLQKVEKNFEQFSKQFAV